MAKSREYVLNRLDKWYADQVRANYTPELAAGFREKVLGRLSSETRDKMEAILEEEDAFSPEVMAELMGCFFSTFWGVFEQEDDALNVTTATVPDGTREEYFQPVVDSFRKIRRMVDSVRAKYDEVFPDELTDDQVRESLFGSFGGVEGFCDYTVEAMRACNALLEKGISGNSSEEDKCALEYLRVVGELSGELNRAIFIGVNEL